MKNLRKIFSTETKTLHDERALLVTISTPTPDRMKDVVVPEGGQLDNYLKNPVVLLFHDYNQLPIGKAVELHVTDSGIRAKVQFPEEGKSAKADEVYSLYKDGFMNAWSIGFAPNYEKATPIKDGGWRFEEWELLEFSAVPVPANAEALTLMRSKGLKAVESVDDVELEDDDYTESVEVAAEEEVEQVETDNSAQEEVTEEPTDAPEEADEIVVDKDAKTMTITSAKGSVVYILNENQLKALIPPTPEPQPEPTARHIELTIETLKEVDQLVGLALRDYKRNTQKQS